MKYLPVKYSRNKNVFALFTLTYSMYLKRIIDLYYMSIVFIHFLRPLNFCTWVNIIFNSFAFSPKSTNRGGSHY